MPGPSQTRTGSRGTLHQSEPDGHCAPARRAWQELAGEDDEVSILRRASGAHEGLGSSSRGCGGAQWRQAASGDHHDQRAFIEGRSIVMSEKVVEKEVNKDKKKQRGIFLNIMILLLIIGDLQIPYYLLNPDALKTVYSSIPSC